MMTEMMISSVGVPVEAVRVLNGAAALLGEAVNIELTESSIHGPEEVAVWWKEDIPQHVKDRVEAAAYEVNLALADNFPLLLASEATGYLALVLNI